VTFARDEARPGLGGSLEVEIQALSALLSRDRGLRLELTGHTSTEGEPSYNLKLGLERARAVRALLAREGLPADRITVKSLGSTQPVAPNADEQGRTKNRRVSYRLVQ